jgi:hypothetical protein
VPHGARATGTISNMQLAATVPVAEPASPVLAQFNYVIRGPQQMARMGLIEARAWPSPPVPVAGGFDEAVAAAKLLAGRLQHDGIHRMPINPAQGVLQAADGQLSIVPLGGFHRGTDGPLFIDGRFFEKTALSLQVTRDTRVLIAVVGAERVLDLRHTGAATVISGNHRTPEATAPEPQPGIFA